MIETFTVDAKLLRELGERLVGRPHIALAELVKNSYDADARLVEITFARDFIEVADDGHGMSHAAFSDRWMRIGTTRKQDERRSPELRRQMTGSKGVGRLAAQVLARRMRLETVGLIDPPMRGLAPRRNASPALLHEGVRANVDWDAAVQAGDLTSVEVEVEEGPPSKPFPGDSACGTRIVLERLTEQWDARRFRMLAQEIWSLQPPFDVDLDDETAFRVRMDTRHEGIVAEFSQQMRAIFDIWVARVDARLLPPGEDLGKPSFVLPMHLEDDGEQDLSSVSADDRLAGGSADLKNDVAEFPARFLQITVHLRDGPARTVLYEMPACRISELEYQVRVFHLQNRQPRNVKLPLARSYLNRFGGVGIYDGGFRLPYYGADVDWLDVDRVHAARISRSRLVPEQLYVSRGMQDLPSNRRLFGAVRVSTTDEAAHAERLALPREQILEVQVTRDRLVDNQAYQQLRVMVRAGLDLYAMERARQRVLKVRKERSDVRRPPSSSFEAIQEAVSDIKDDLSPSAYLDLSRAVDAAADDARVLEESVRAHASLLGALATAGMTSLAYEHEVSKQSAALQALSTNLALVLDDLPADTKATVADAVQEMERWLERSQSIRKIFRPLLDEEARTVVRRFRARALADDVANQLTILARGTVVNVSRLPRHLRLPRGGYAAWSAVFQNLYINAFNAVLETPNPRVDVDGEGTDECAWVRVQDNGIGIDLDDAERLFEPFERGRPISRERAALGLGGSGLGLTIVRMITDEFGCTVRFTEPDDAHNTAVTISWSHAT